MYFSIFYQNVSLWFYIRGRGTGANNNCFFCKEGCHVCNYHVDGGFFMWSGCLCLLSFLEKLLQLVPLSLIQISRIWLWHLLKSSMLYKRFRLTFLRVEVCQHFAELDRKSGPLTLYSWRNPITFNRHRIVGLCKSLTINAVNLKKSVTVNV